MLNPAPRETPYSAAGARDPMPVRDGVVERARRGSCSGVVTTELRDTIGGGGSPRRGTRPHRPVLEARRPAAVVPPGDVTAARSASGSPRPAASSVAEPSSVCSTSACRDRRGAGPPSTPPSMSASATSNTYAGPEPESPVTASSCCSATRTTMPTARRSRSASSRCSLGRGRAGRDGGRAEADERGRVRHRPHDRPARRGGFERRDRDARRRSRARACRAASAGERGLERRGRRRPASPRRSTTSASATAHAAARHHAHLGELRLELVAAVGVDLGDRDVVGVVAAVEQAARAAPRPSARHRAARREPSRGG